MESVCTPLQSTALPTELKPGGGLSRHVQDSNLRGQSPMDFESNSLTARTTCLEEKVTPWESNPVNRAREALGVNMCIDMCRARPPSGTTGLEPVRARPNRFLVELLNHSDKCPSEASCIHIEYSCRGSNPGPSACEADVMTNYTTRASLVVCAPCEDRTHDLRIAGEPRATCCWVLDYETCALPTELKGRV